MVAAESERKQRKAWLAQRRTGIGSSDIAAVCNLSKWMSPFRLYLDKLGLLPEDADSDPMKFGRWLEPVVANAYADATGLIVQEPARLTYRHPLQAHCMASPDRLVFGGRNADGVLDSGARILECKTAHSSEGWGPSGTDQVPMPYLLQVQWQLLVLAHEGCAYADLAVLIGQSDFRIYPNFYPVPEIQTELLRRAGEFWALVQARTPPPIPWDDPEMSKLLDILYPPAEPEVEHELSLEELSDVSEYERLGERIKALEGEREMLRARITQAMGVAGRANLPDGRALSRKLVVTPEKHVPATIKPRREYVRLAFVKGKNAHSQAEEEKGLSSDE